MMLANRLGIAFIAVGCGMIAWADDRMPIEVFFKNAEFSHVRLSPDGKRLAALARIQAAPQSRNLIVLDIGDRSVQTLTGYKEEDIRWTFWASDERLVFKVDRDYDSPDKASEYLGTYSIRYDGKKGRQIHEPFQKDSRGIRGVGGGAGQIGGVRETINVVDDLPMDQDHILVEMTDRRLLFTDVYKLTLKNRNMDTVAVNEKNTFEWHADNKGVVRAGIDAGEVRDNFDYELIYRKDEKSPWRTVTKFRNDDLHILGFDEDDLHLWVAARLGFDKLRLYRLNPESGDFGAPLVENPEYDVHNESIGNVSGLMQTDTGRVVYYEYMADKPVRVFFDEKWAERQQVLDQAFPDTENSIIDWDRDETRFLVRTWSDRVYSSYYLYDEKAAKVKFLLASAQWLDPTKMAPMQPVSYEARDGMKMHGYLTLPLNAEDGKVPLIVHPHGGPYGIRDGWGYNQDVQFLASRGYGVLQINYRGSGGYGLKHMASGYKRWGLEMQDDLTDGVAWAIEQGIADPDRVCIYGASYGGYATVMGMTKTPDLYKCGINYVGVTDLNLLYTDFTRKSEMLAPESNRIFFEDFIGTPDRNKEQFQQTSPVNHVENIQAPLLVIHGLQDQRVDVEHYRRLIAQLKKHDKPHDKLMKRYEGHGFFVEQNKIELYTKIEEFLADNL